MPLGKGIVEAFGAIPDRIEVSGQGPTWKVTGGSFEDTLAFVEGAYADAVVIARADRGRWWPRVTLTVTRDPLLAAVAPDVATFATPTLVEDPAGHLIETPVDTPSFASALEEIFAHQEELRMARGGFPSQRAGG